jgi:hypothetical protein
LCSLAFHAKAQTAGAREQINGTHFGAVSLHLIMRLRQDITDTISNSVMWVTSPPFVRGVQFWSRSNPWRSNGWGASAVTRRHFPWGLQNFLFDPANWQRTASRKDRPRMGISRCRTTVPSALALPGLNPGRGPVP